MRRFDKHIPIEKIIKRRRTAADFKRFWRPGRDNKAVPGVDGGLFGHQHRFAALALKCRHERRRGRLGEPGGVDTGFLQGVR